MTITDPGVYADLPADVYHADPVPGGSLSSSGARRLLPPSCPAVFEYERRNPRLSTEEMELGTAAHKLVLGDGPQIVRVEADSWRTKAAREEADAVRANGGIPLLPDDHDKVTAMAGALRGHPIAAALLHPERGKAEQSLFWTDLETGVNLRARLDWLPNPTPGRRLVIPDYKTARSADPGHIAKDVASFGYHQQAAWYLDGVTALGLDEDPAFVLVVQEKNPPYLVTVVELDTEALTTGRRLNRRAIDVYHRCVTTGHWPGYADDVVPVSLPTWALYQAEEVLL